MWSRHLLSSIRTRSVSSRKSLCSVLSRASLSACLLARILAVFSSDNVVPTLVSAALLDSSSAAQIERASVPRSVQVSHELAELNIFWIPAGCRDNDNLWLLLSDTKKRLVESKGDLKESKGEEKVFLDKIQSLKAEYWSLCAKKNCLKSVQEENMSTVSYRKLKTWAFFPQLMLDLL